MALSSDFSAFKKEGESLKENEMQVNACNGIMEVAFLPFFFSVIS